MDIHEQADAIVRNVETDQLDAEIGAWLDKQDSIISELAPTLSADEREDLKHSFDLAEDWVTHPDSELSFAIYAQAWLDCLVTHTEAAK